MKYSINKKPKIGDLICVKHHISTVSSGLILRDFEKIFGCANPTISHEHTDCMNHYFFVGSIGVILDIQNCQENNLVVYGGALSEREIALRIDTWIKCYAYDYKDLNQKLIWVRSKNIIIL